ncbi:Dual specificity protein tyrosine phosphatase CCP1 [Spathaspora sp. JA1]|nr:Dual specificity protein tyrosine phosphatase CCP1 [Spathaspora sp. JA1]
MASPFLLSKSNRTIATPSATKSLVTTTVTTTSTANSTELNNILRFSSMPLPTSFEQDSTVTSDQLQQPPQLKYEYENNSPSSSLSSSATGLMNYSPKHSRKPSSLNSNRNMKNLSLNLHSSHSSSSSSSSFMSSPSISKHGAIATTAKKLSVSIPNLSINDDHNNITSATTLVNPGTLHDDLMTPLVTHTPTIPPALNPQVHTNTPGEYKFPPSSPPLPLVEQMKQNDPNKPRNSRPLSRSIDMSLLNSNSVDSFDHSLIQPPPAPPFAPGNKGSPLSTPPRLTGPLILNGISPETPGSLSDELSRVSLREDSLISSNNPQSIFTAYYKQRAVPEELQESNQLDAYPDGPVSVLNNRIFLYSDPFTSGRVDINDYNLVINVAKECKDMSLYYNNAIPGEREYIFVPWLHTSPISKDLPRIIEKIDSFYNKGYRILIHCQCGVSRSACVVVAYFMLKYSLGVNEAYELLKNGTRGNRQVCNMVRSCGDVITGSDRICPNMSLIFELMELGDSLCNNEVTTNALLFDSPSAMQI